MLTEAVTIETQMRLDSEVRDLCDELTCLQERANRRLEDLENEFQGAQWLDSQMEMFSRLRRLVRV
jgi:hypothetical protein